LTTSQKAWLSSLAELGQGGQAPSAALHLFNWLY